jgi:hypothetical protein
MARRITHASTVTTSNIVTTSNSTPIYVGRAKSISVQSVIDVNTPSAKTFVDGDVNTTTDRITITGHSFATTGLKVAATTDGVLPGGLSATNYYVIVVDANTIKLATSLANAQAGTAVDITSAAGGGTHTLTPASLAGCTVALQKSNDYDPEQNTTGTWDDAVSGSVTADGDVWSYDTDPDYAYVRLSFTLTAGRLSATSYIIIKEDI